MATTTWTGAVSGDISNASNWSGGVPSGGDDAIINAGDRNINAGLTSLAAVDLASVFIGPKYTGNIGNSDDASTAMLQIAAAKVTINGGGPQQYILNTSANIDDIEIIRVGPSGTGNITIGGTLVKTVVRGGNVRILSGTLTTAYLLADGGLPSSASITHYAGTITTLYKGSGNYATDDLDDDGEDRLGTGTVTSHYNLSGSAQFGPSSTMTNVYLMGGNVYHTASATITLARVLGGVLDGRASKYAPTITTLDLFAGGSALFDGSAFAASISTKNNYGGNLSE